MAYRFNGVECDTFEELQRLQGTARTTSAVVKETRSVESCGSTDERASGFERCTLKKGHRGPCKFPLRVRS